MGGFDGINQFGNLTTSSGKKLTFEDFDKNKDGEVTKAEYEEVVKDMQLDSVELSSIDNNGDEVMTEDEFQLWEQKVQMQEAVNELSSQISKDFAGKTEYIEALTTELKLYIEEYADNFTGEISEMAEAFKLTLPSKYEAIKSEILANDPETIKSEVLDEIYTEIITSTKNESNLSLEESVAKSLVKALETEAGNFIKSYTGSDLKTDLKAHLDKYMNMSDAEKMADAVSEFNKGVASLGAYLDDGGDLIKLKEYAKDFLLAAIDNGVSITLAGTNIKTEVAITTALNKFSSSEELKAALDEVIAALGTETLREKIEVEEKDKAEDAAEKAFTEIEGAEYSIDSNLIDYSGIDGYFDNSVIHERGKGWSGSREAAFEKGKELLNSDNLKNQIKSQIEQMLSEKGISFDKVEALFENVYAQSITDTLNAEGMITGRGARGFSSKGHAYINIKNCVDSFIATFNTNIAKAIDEMNASSTDLDIQDIDRSAADEDEYGNVSEVKTTEVGFNVQEDIETNANTICERMKSQLLRKANAMCVANGIDFDNKVFTTIFNNAKMSAISVATSVEYIFGHFGYGEIDKTLLLDTMFNEFKTDYTQWVNTEKEKE